MIEEVKLLFVNFEDGFSILVLLFVLIKPFFTELFVLLGDDLGYVGHLLAWVFIFDLLVHFLLEDEKGALRAFRWGWLC